MALATFATAALCTVPIGAQAAEQTITCTTGMDNVYFNNVDNGRASRVCERPAGTGYNYHRVRISCDSWLTAARYGDWTPFGDSVSVAVCPAHTDGGEPEYVTAAEVEYKD
ncbi:hypothetical protein D5S17_17725 [Pseudonocardiaceae bacterium YIM PH 21723]|nr:hypothetical protein D5S17_17725 [Pseudonocardiaceae bacterium YIM PH 21723]